MCCKLTDQIVKLREIQEFDRKDRTDKKISLLESELSEARRKVQSTELRYSTFEAIQNSQSKELKVCCHVLLQACLTHSILWHLWRERNCFLYCLYALRCSHISCPGDTRKRASYSSGAQNSAGETARGAHCVINRKWRTEVPGRIVAVQIAAE